MKFNKLFLIIAIGTLPSSAVAQKADKILKKSELAHLSIDSGYFEMTELFKSMGGEDTFQSVTSCYFITDRTDSIFGAKFYSSQLRQGKYQSNAIYTNNEFVSFRTTDSTGTYYKTSEWGGKLQRIKHNYYSYKPFIGDKKFQYLYDTGELVTTTYEGKAMVNGIKCHKIKAVKTYPYDSSALLHGFRYEVNYYINSKDFVLVQYEDWFDIEMNNDTMLQYYKHTLNTYQLNKKTSVSNKIDLASIPDYVDVKPYTVGKGLLLPLPIDTIAPTWSLYSVDSQMYNLNDLKGKIVVIDFFYRACYPCMLAIPKIQTIHEKYINQGVVVLGIDPFDERTEGFKAFLASRGVTYPVLLGAGGAAKDYRVQGYPRIFVIGKDGVIIYIHEGYSDEMEEELETIIKENL